MQLMAELLLCDARARKARLWPHRRERLAPKWVKRRCGADAASACDGSEPKELLPFEPKGLPSSVRAQVTWLFSCSEDPDEPYRQVDGTDEEYGCAEARHERMHDRIALHGSVRAQIYDEARSCGDEGA